jgi:hypothetical protein
MLIRITKNLTIHVLRYTGVAEDTVETLVDINNGDAELELHV